MDSLVVGDSPLTERETEVLRAARDGAAGGRDRQRVHLSAGTVRNHLSSAIGKTGAANRAEAVLIADRQRLALTSVFPTAPHLDAATALLWCSPR